MFHFRCAAMHHRGFLSVYITMATTGTQQHHEHPLASPTKPSTVRIVIDKNNRDAVANKIYHGTREKTRGAPQGFLIAVSQRPCLLV
jgi:hypothetical protein